MDLNPQEFHILNQLELLLRNGDVLQDAVYKLSQMTRDPAAVARAVEVRHEIAFNKRHIALDSGLVDPEDIPPPWYTGPSPEDIFWPALKSFWEADPKWAPAVPALDDMSTNIVGLLANPHAEIVNTRGLVIGNVQSGKTANFTATIAKSADAGYRLFIVLSGVHNALRRQTQLRLDQQLCDLKPQRWVQLTDEDRDFGNPIKAMALVTSDQLRLLAVVKKNVSRLTRLRDWLYQANQHRGLDECPVLVIDDESDQASPNAAKDPELDHTAINERIMELLSLPKVAYVGYTATPFANVLINPADAEDLYPRSFIYSLPKPPGYFGSEELFGGLVSEEEENEENSPHDMIRIVPEEEAARYRITKSNPLSPQVTPSLAQAIRWFFMATAARQIREGAASHSSMLIHTTMRVAPQLSYMQVVREFIEELRANFDSDKALWSTQWERELNLEPPERFGLRRLPFSEISEKIGGLLSSVNVVADNSQSEERLIYTDDPATVIAVGGNTLSRGLTLEGLVSSYFLRSSNTYDSLLQMGRWFGYRPQYEDLPRIWTTEELANSFRFLAEIERDLRQDVERYRLERVTPRQLAVRIRVHPRMQVTAKNKMHFAVPGEASYSGERPQTTYFHHQDAMEIARNRNAAKNLIRSALDSGIIPDVSKSQVVLRDIPFKSILGFIENFTFHPDTELRSELLAKYIRKQVDHGGLELWNVAVITRQQEGRSMDLGLGREVNLLTRSKLKSSTDLATANIGTLMSRPDRVIDLIDTTEVARISKDDQLLDLRTESGHGLLLLYPIDKDSSPKPSGAKHRVTLGAVEDLLGTAFSFPRAVEGSEPRNAVQVDLGRVTIESPDSEEDGFETGDALDAYVDIEGDRDDVDLGDA